MKKLAQLKAGLWTYYIHSAEQKAVQGRAGFQIQQVGSLGKR